MENYDVIVIGAGSGGLVAAISAHRKGLKTAYWRKTRSEDNAAITDVCRAKLYKYHQN